MGSIDSDEMVIERVLSRRAEFYAAPNRFRTLTNFDREHGSFLLVDEGWDGYKRIHTVWAHIELRDGQLWIHEDGTQDGLATDLMNEGIPQERIVLAFQEPRGAKAA